MNTIERLISNPSIVKLVKDSTEYHRINQQSKINKAIALISQELDSIDFDIEAMTESGKLSPGWEILPHEENCVHLIYEKKISKRIYVSVVLGSKENVVMLYLKHTNNVYSGILNYYFDACRDERGIATRNGYVLSISQVNPRINFKQGNKK